MFASWRLWLAGAVVAAVVGVLFLVYPFGPWLIWNIAVPVAGLTAALVAAPRMPRLGFRFALLISLGWLGISVSAELFHRSRLPPDVQVRGIVAEGWLSGFTDRCGAIVFRLASATVADIERRGIAALTGRQPFEEQWPTATGWLPTPLPTSIASGTNADARSWGGLDCSLSPMWAWSIKHAASEPGSFYRIGYGRILLLSPSLGIIAVAFNSGAS